MVDSSVKALGRVVKNLDADKWHSILLGKRVFVREWKYTKTGEHGYGLGPYHNGNSCSACHFRDGRGASAQETEPLLTIKLALPVVNGSSTGLPYYGTQFHRYAEGGLLIKGKIELKYEDTLFELGNFSSSLRRPIISYRELKNGPLPNNAVSSARIPGSLVGLGLLEVIPQQSILHNADPHDRNQDEISGRANWIRVAGGGRKLGRFGWKAAQPTIAHQVATALNEDMGIRSTLSPKSSCAENDLACSASDKAEEIKHEDFQNLITYVRLLAVPKRRGLNDPIVQRGKTLFYQIGCPQCHTPKFKTSATGPHPELLNQVIYPYTDLLLHDMGNELADNYAEQSARGSEWRTPPLWGLGLLRKIHGSLFLLHDGRAQSVQQAVLWHGGEAAHIRSRFALLSKTDRQALEKFVESL